jgi:hypothetical protein
MNADECRALDWRTVGYEDGVAGYSGDRIAQYRKACGKYGVRADLAAYQVGRDQGLREYCRPSNGFRVGSRGYSYNGVCPADMDRGFSEAYESGRQLYVLRERVNDVNEAISAHRRELHHIDEALVHNAATIVSFEATPEDRAHAAIETKDLAERAGRLKAEIPQLEVDRERCERDLDAYRSTLRYVE